MAKTTQWKKGFYLIAKRADIPITVGYIDFRKKEIGIKGVIHDTSNINAVMQQINEMYKNVSGRNPDNFVLEKMK